MMRLADMSQDLIKSFGWLIVKGDERHIANGKLMYQFYPTLESGSVSGSASAINRICLVPLLFK